jgi:hypothetical protein
MMGSKERKEHSTMRAWIPEEIRKSVLEFRERFLEKLTNSEICKYATQNPPTLRT